MGLGSQDFDASMEEKLTASFLGTSFRKWVRKISLWEYVKQWKIYFVRWLDGLVNNNHSIYTN